MWKCCLHEFVLHWVIACCHISVCIILYLCRELCDVTIIKMEADAEGGDPGAQNSDQKNRGSTSYAEILTHIGEFGRWQQFIFLWSEIFQSYSACFASGSPARPFWSFHRFPLPPGTWFRAPHYFGKGKKELPPLLTWTNHTLSHWYLRRLLIIWIGLSTIFDKGLLEYFHYG